MKFTESNFIPFEAGLLPPGPWLIFVPHPDDETFGLGGTLLKARQQGILVDLCLLTDGSQGGEHSTSAQEVALIERRWGEFKTAANLLGCRDLVNLHQHDRQLSATAELVEKVVTIIQASDVKTVFFPSPYEPHPDHRAACQLVWQALQRLQHKPAAISYEVLVQSSPINLLIDITAEYQEKQQLIGCYDSQLNERAYGDFASALDRLRAVSMPSTTVYCEAFYQYSSTELASDLTDVIAEHARKLLA